MYNTLRITSLGEWRNGRRDRLKICCPYGRVGSTPTLPTIIMADLPVIKTLKNGLKVVYIPFPGIDSATFNLIGKAGGVWEKQEEYGIAHFIEHLAFDGTEKYPNPDDLRGLIENVGGLLNAYTSEFEVNYYVKVLGTELERAFEMQSQQIMHPLFRNEDIEKQRSVITQEYHMYRDSPVENFYLNSDERLYAKGSRLRNPLIGTLDTLKIINRDMIRDYFRRNYNSSNFVLCVCGNGLEKDVFELAEKYFGSLQEGEKNSYAAEHYVDEHMFYAEKNIKVQQATLSVVYPAAEIYTKAYYAGKIVSNIIGGGFLSRFFREIRQKHGLAYNVRCEYLSFLPFGLFNHEAQVDPKNIEKVLMLMKIEIDKLVKEGITQAEYDRTRKIITSRFVFNNESPEKRAYIQGKLVLEGKKNETYETQLNKLMDVKLEDVNKAAKEIYSHHPKFRILSNIPLNEQVLNAWQS